MKSLQLRFNLAVSAVSFQSDSGKLGCEFNPI